MIKQIVCDCGWSAEESEHRLVAAAQAHGREAHGTAATPERVRALAVAVAVADQANQQEE